MAEKRKDAKKWIDNINKCNKQQNGDIKLLHAVLFLIKVIQQILPVCLSIHGDVLTVLDHFARYGRTEREIHLSVQFLNCNQISTSETTTAWKYSSIV